MDPRFRFLSGCKENLMAMKKKTASCKQQGTFFLDGRIKTVLIRSLLSASSLYLVQTYNSTLFRVSSESPISEWSIAVPGDRIVGGGTQKEISFSTVFFCCCTFYHGSSIRIYLSSQGGLEVRITLGGSKFSLLSAFSENIIWSRYY